MKLFVSALEASSNLHLKFLLRELAKLGEVEVCGVFVSSSLEDTNCTGQPLYSLEQFSVMGFLDVVKKLKFFLKANRKMLDLALECDKILLMDSSSFNIPLARKIKKSNPNKEVMYYILPQVWAWKPWRAKGIYESCDKLAAILPFEIEFYPETSPLGMQCDRLREFQAQTDHKSSLCLKFSQNSHSHTANAGSLDSKLHSLQPPNLTHDARILESNLSHSHTAKQGEAAVSLVNAGSLDSKTEAKNENLESSLRESGVSEAIHNTESKSVESKEIETSGLPRSLATSRNDSNAESLKDSTKLESATDSVKYFTKLENTADFSIDSIINENLNLAQNLSDSTPNETPSSTQNLNNENLNFTQSLKDSIDSTNNENPNSTPDSTNRNNLPKIRYVGHPLLDEITLFRDTQFYSTNKTESNLITFMPGSRMGEIRRIFPTFIRVKNALKDSNLTFNLVVPKHFKSRDLGEIYGDLSDFEIVFDAQKSLYESRFAFICSGTATLECAIIGTPFVLCYQASKFDAFIVRRFLKIRYVGLANILYSKICPDKAFHKELLQEDFNVENMLCEYEQRNVKDFFAKSMQIREFLGQGSASYVAKWLFLENS